MDYDWQRHPQDSLWPKSEALHLPNHGPLAGDTRTYGPTTGDHKCWGVWPTGQGRAGRARGAPSGLGIRGKTWWQWIGQGERTLYVEWQLGGFWVMVCSKG